MLMCGFICGWVVERRANLIHYAWSVSVDGYNRWICTLMRLVMEIFGFVLDGLILIFTSDVYHGGRMYGSIVSIDSVMYGNCWRIFSRFDWWRVHAVLVRIACANHACSGCFEDSVCIRVIAHSTLLCSRSHVGWRPVSISRAAVGAILKHPIMAFIASLCIVVNLRACMVFAILLSSLGLCQTMAA